MEMNAVTVITILIIGLACFMLGWTTRGTIVNNEIIDSYDEGYRDGWDDVIKEQERIKTSNEDNGKEVES